MRLVNSFVQNPSLSPVVDNFSDTFLVAHRRVNQDDRYSELSPIQTNVGFPFTATPQTYSDTDALKRDEFLVSADGITWRLVPRDNETDTGAQTITAFDAAWPVASLSSNQTIETNLLNFGTFTGGSNPELVIYAVNDGNSISTITVNLTDSITNSPAFELDGRFQVEILETRTAAGNNGVTTYNGSLTWGLPADTFNTFNVLLNTGSFVKIRISLINFPSGGLASIDYNLNFTLTGNQTKFNLSYPDQWLDQSVVYDPSLNLTTDIISSTDGNVLSIIPFITKFNSTILKHLVTRTITIPSVDSYKLWFSFNGVFTLELSTAADRPGEFLVAEFDSLAVSPFITNVVYPWPIRTFDFNHKTVNGGSIARARFVTFNSSNELVLATTSDGLLGITLKDNQGFYATSGVAWLQIGQTVATGDRLSPGTDGKGAVNPTGEVLALQAGTTDDYILVELLNFVGSGASGGASALGDLTDVDLTTTPPVNNDSLVFNSASGNWIPGAVASGGAQTISFNPQAGTTYTAALTDVGPNKSIEFDNAGDIDFTIPANSAVGIPVGSVIPFAQVGTGQVILVEDTGVTINAADGSDRTRTIYSTAMVLKVATDEWRLMGDVI